MGKMGKIDTLDLLLAKGECAENFS